MAGLGEFDIGFGLLLHGWWWCCFVVGGIFLILSLAFYAGCDVALAGSRDGGFITLG